MIKLTKINNETFYLNAEIIETIEEKPHTLVKTSNERTYVVKESAKEVRRLVIEYKRNILSDQGVDLDE